MRHTWFKRVALGVAAALVASACAGTTTSPSQAPATQAAASGAAAFKYPTEQITLTMFGSDEQPSNDLEKKWAAEYHALHPNVTIDPQLTPLGPAFDKLTVQLPANSGPDLFTVYEPWIETFYQGGWLAPAIPEAFGVKDQKGIQDLYVPNSLDAMTRSGTVYLLPFSQPSWGLLINNKKFTAASTAAQARATVEVRRAEVAAAEGRLFDDLGR